jgi:hypothetical protein
LIDKDRLVGLHYGCAPSKNLIKLSRMVRRPDEVPHQQQQLIGAAEVGRFLSRLT